MATLTHALVTNVRRCSRDLAVLQAVGFVRRQVEATVRWQATVAAAAALVVGLPVGGVAGRWAWAVVVERVGATALTVVPAGILLTTATVVVVLANFVAVLPAGAAARTGSAQVLRTE